MPDVLLRITATNTATAAIEQAARSLSGLDAALSGVGANSARIQTALNSVNIAASRQAGALNQAAVAADNYARLQARLAAPAGDTSRLEDQIARARLQSVTATDRAAESTVRLANAQATLNQRQKEATDAASGSSAAHSSGGSGGEGGIGGAIRSAALYGGVYTGLYAAGSLLTGSISNNAQYSRLLGTTQGFTGGTAADRAEIDRYIQQQAGSGTLPYTPTQLLSGYYGLASADLYGGVKPTEQIAGRDAQLAAAAGDPDPSGMNALTLALVGAYGQNGPGLVAASRRDQDQAVAAIIKGQYSASDFAAVVPRARATIGRQAGVSTGDTLAYLAAESNVGISADQAALDFGSLVQSLVRPNAVQRRVAKAAGIDLSPGFLGRDGGLSGFLELLQTRIGGLSEPEQATLLAGLTGNRAAGGGLAAVLGNARNQGLFSYVAGANDQTAQSAIDAYNATPGAKLANSQAQFSTALDSLTKTALPAFTTAIQGATTVLKDAADLFAGPGGKGGIGGSVSAATNVLNRALNPTDPAFGNLDKARQEVADQIERDRRTPPRRSSLLGTPTGSGLFDIDPSVASFFNGIGGAKDNLLKGFTNGTGYAQAAGLTGSDFDGRSAYAHGLPTQTAQRTYLNAEDIRNATLQGMTQAAPVLAQATGLSAAQSLALARAGLAQAEIPGRGSGTGRTSAASRAVRFIDAPGIGALEAGPGSTAVRFAGQLDPEALELRQLRQENGLLRGVIAADNLRIIGLLAQIAGQGARQGIRQPNAVVSSGGGRGYKG